MIGKRQIWQRTHRRHMALHASTPRHRSRVPGRRVTLGASRVVARESLLQRRMRRMTGKAGEPPAAVAKTFAQGKHQRLMPRVPRIVQVRRARRRSRHPMTRAANIIQFIRRKLCRVAWMHRRRIAHMRCRRSVTHFAPHACFQRHDTFIRCRHAHRPRRMTRKAAQNRGGRIENPVSNPIGILMTRGQSHAVQPPVPALPELEILFRVCAAHEGDSLQSRAESPLARLRRRRSLQRVRVRRCRLRRILGCMARFASRRARILGHGSLRHRDRNQKRRESLPRLQKMNFPEN